MQLFSVNPNFLFKGVDVCFWDMGLSHLEVGCQESCEPPRCLRGVLLPWSMNSSPCFGRPAGLFDPIVLLRFGIRQGLRACTWSSLVLVLRLGFFCLAVLHSFTLCPLPWDVNSQANPSHLAEIRFASPKNRHEQKIEACPEVQVLLGDLSLKAEMMRCWRLDG